MAFTTDTSTRIHRLLVIVLAAGLLQSCNEPTTSESTTDPPSSPTPRREPVHFAVGNWYAWQFTRVGIGTFFQWNDTTAITNDLIIGSHTYYEFDSGERLRISGDWVFVHDGSPYAYYRLNANVGDTVPFLGHSFRVTSVDTESVLGSYQTVITVANQLGASTLVTSARYASKFGIIRITTGSPPGSSYVTTKNLRRARIGSVVYD